MDFLKNIDFGQHVLPAAIIILSFITGLIVKKTVIKKLAKLAAKSKARFDDIFVKSLQSVILVWFVLIGLYISTSVLPISGDQKIFLGKISQALLVFSIFWFLMNFLSDAFFVYSEKLRERIPETSIIKNVIRIFILCIGILIILQTIGVSITPIITTLGIGGLAIALALQETLANLFAGFHILASQRVKPGDYIRLDSGEEGYVVDVTLRDTVLKQLPENHVILPNSKISSSVVVNFYRPKKALKVLVEVGVDYDSDLEKVEKVTVEVARETLREAAGGAEDFTPFLRYHTFADSSINFTVHLKCEEFFDRFLVQHEFIKRLKKRYDREGINIPFPIRTLITKKGDS
ncbi:MAG: mechanosensitive ion channel family protein [Candidatus Aminicenantes bacterium]|nr:mechanosensitive ion channel family protein [Candidatus Aminicenantes bacterium]